MTMNPKQRAHELRRLKLELLKLVPVERQLALARDEQRRAFAHLSAVAALTPDADTLAKLDEKTAELKRTLGAWEAAYAKTCHLRTSIRAMERQAEEPAA